jgi:hypothetical protein
VSLKHAKVHVGCNKGITCRSFLELQAERRAGVLARAGATLTPGLTSFYAPDWPQNFAELARSAATCRVLLKSATPRATPERPRGSAEQKVDGKNVARGDKAFFSERALRPRKLRGACVLAAPLAGPGASRPLSAAPGRLACSVSLLWALSQALSTSPQERWPAASSLPCLAAQAPFAPSLPCPAARQARLVQRHCQAQQQGSKASSTGGDRAVAAAPGVSSLAGKLSPSRGRGKLEASRGEHCHWEALPLQLSSAQGFLFI